MPQLCYKSKHTSSACTALLLQSKSGLDFSLSGLFSLNSKLLFAGTQLLVTKRPSKMEKKEGDPVSRSMFFPSICGNLTLQPSWDLSTALAVYHLVQQVVLLNLVTPLLDML